MQQIERYQFILNMNPDIEERVMRNPLLNIDTFVIPSPFVHNPAVRKDYEHSYVWVEEGEILGYMLVYSDPAETDFLIYKIVTSPFGRGRGIGSSFIEQLAEDIPDSSAIHIHIWEKQIDTIEFFQKYGFQMETSIAYRKLVYHRLIAAGPVVLEQIEGLRQHRDLAPEEISKTRHDARKVTRLISSMVEALGSENSGKIVENINRESTTLINILNAFRDNMKIVHNVDLLALIFERIVPYVQSSDIRCELRLDLDTGAPTIQGYYIDIGRALVNIVSNALDAIEEADRKGIIDISLRETGEFLNLTIADNGMGIPLELLEKDEQGFPRFVGKTTKGKRTGEGIGTQQIYATFGAENIEVSSILGQGTSWSIRFHMNRETVTAWYVQMNRRYNEFKDLWEVATVLPDTPRREVVAYIWQIRKIEIFMFDLITQFSRYHNIRDIYRTILGYLQGVKTEAELKQEIGSLKCDVIQYRNWLIDISREIYRRSQILEEAVNPDNFWASLFRSYGQAYRNVIIFTTDPETGNFFATDRKLAEHLDFVPYLKKERDKLLRGEFLGDLNVEEKPIHFGVWSIRSREDALTKLRLIRKGVQTFMKKGIHAEKRLAFYPTTYVSGGFDIDINTSSTFGDFAKMPDSALEDFLVKRDEEMDGFLLARE